MNELRMDSFYVSEEEWVNENCKGIFRKLLLHKWDPPHLIKDSQKWIIGQRNGGPPSDCSPLISAASCGRLRLVRLLVEGGAQVNGCNLKGETALLAVCKALRGEPPRLQTFKVLTYLLSNKADPNVQDRSGRTALMYACMEQAGAQVASSLVSAGADPSMEDHSGASALVYAVNAQDEPTLKVLMDACRARGWDIIIIASEVGVNGGPVTRRCLNVPPTLDTSPVSCTDGSGKLT